MQKVLCILTVFLLFCLFNIGYMTMGIDATATAIVNSSNIPRRVLVSLFASSITLSMLSGPNIGGTNMTLSNGAAVAIINSIPTIFAVFLWEKLPSNSITPCI